MRNVSSEETYTREYHGYWTGTLKEVKDAAINLIESTIDNPDNLIGELKLKLTYYRNADERVYCLDAHGKETVKHVINGLPNPPPAGIRQNR